MRLEALSLSLSLFLNFDVLKDVLQGGDDTLGMAIEAVGIRKPPAPPSYLPEPASDGLSPSISSALKLERKRFHDREQRLLAYKVPTGHSPDGRRSFGSTFSQPLLSLGRPTGTWA